ncbi:hypothetical protein ACR6C2_12690 [Streptomyces sp. INA 01156]
MYDTLRSGRWERAYMGWTVLYIAFGVVALWLLGEVLLQYKARLRWRLLAFAGFLGVVLGVLIQTVLVIGLGAVAFAIGQTYVTLSFRRGFAAGWAVNAPALAAVKGGRVTAGGRNRPWRSPAWRPPATATAAGRLRGRGRRLPHRPEHLRRGRLRPRRRVHADAHRAADGRRDHRRLRAAAHARRHRLVRRLRRQRRQRRQR